MEQVDFFLWFFRIFRIMIQESWGFFQLFLRDQGSGRNYAEIIREAEEVTGIEFNTRGKIWVEGIRHSTEIRNLGILLLSECHYPPKEKLESVFYLESQ